MLKPIAAILSPHVWFSGRKERQEDPEARQTATENLARVNVTLRVFLGTAHIAVKDLVNLKVGDVICLDTPKDEDLALDISGQTCFYGRVGKVGKQVAVQVTAAVGPSKKLLVKGPKKAEKHTDNQVQK
jgi:flagellar motor switch protein FliM